MKNDRIGNNKKRKLEEVLQKLEQAKVSGDKFQIKIWSDVLKKLKNDSDGNDKYKAGKQ